MSRAPAPGPRVALFGGSFDPPHRGHLALARAARDELQAAQVLWIPAGQPWQKAGRRLAAAEHRAAMVAAMIDGEPGMVLDRRELQRDGPSYTLDTVRELSAEQPQAQWWLVLGQDQYARLHTWHGVPELLARVSLAVATRDGQAPQAPAELSGLPHRLQALQMPPVSVSSTALRQAAGRGDDISSLAGEPVARYIALHHLYRG